MSDSCHERPKNSKIADFLDTVQNFQTCKKVCLIGLRAYINIIFLVFLFIKKQTMKEYSQLAFTILLIILFCLKYL
ncbi:hypothetical protein ABY99_06130 [Listeria monocytogenes]|nr:hypothetical protein [Listeria monocytogenes]